MYLEEYNSLTKIILIIVLLALVSGTHAFNSSFAYALEEDEKEPEKLQNIAINPLSSSLSSNAPYSLLDPNPSLIDKHGNLINNISLAASLTTYRNGTIADGVSKLILLVYSNNMLQFSINGTKPDDLTNGTLTSLNQSSNVNNLSSTTIVSPQNIINGKSVVAAVYTPPDSFNNQYTGSNRIINVNVSDPNNPANTLYELPIHLYRPPVILIHGIWTNSKETWVENSFTKINFSKTLKDSGFNITFANYENHNSETFDPYAIKTIGNYGIDATRNAIHKILEGYHNQSIAASQVDVVAHSMGGLMARGFVQQPDYIKQDNFMKGSIHRLITLGTPHFGGNLSKILDHYSDHLYCRIGLEIKPPTQNCEAQLGGQLEDLKTIFNNTYKVPIDQGGVKALIPGSIAYSHLCQTNVTSYAIAGRWNPKATVSHVVQEGLYRNITENGNFDLDKDGFNDQNDLVVSVKSQLGGLPNQTRQSESNNIPNNDNIPNQSAVYPNIVHAPRYTKGTNIYSETMSPDIQQDVITLLGSSAENKFSDAIGIGSVCHIPTK